jgi:hypothetical protein
MNDAKRVTVACSCQAYAFELWCPKGINPCQFTKRTRSTSNDQDVVQDHIQWYKGQYTEHDAHIGMFGSQQIGTVTEPRRHHIRKGKQVESGHLEDAS